MIPDGGRDGKRDGKEAGTINIGRHKAVGSLKVAFTFGCVDITVCWVGGGLDGTPNMQGFYGGRLEDPIHFLIWGEGFLYSEFHIELQLCHRGLVHVDDL